MPDRVPVPGSERPLPPGVTLDGATAVDPDQRIEVSVYLRTDPAAERFDPAAEALKAPRERRYLSPEEAEAHYGAAADELAQLAAHAQRAGLTVTEQNRAAARVRVSGGAAQIADYFGVELRQVASGDARFRTHTGPVRVDAEIAATVQGVFGLDDRPLGRSFRRPATRTLNAAIQAWHDAGGAAAGVQVPHGSFLPPHVATLYDFPTGTADGQTVAVFAFNGPDTPGGYEATVLDTYFRRDLHLASPTITDVTVLGPGNSPGDGSNPDDASPEVYLDLSLVGALASDAAIVIYFTEFTEQGWVDGLTTASTDATEDPDVISISYGNPEDGSGTAWTTAAVQQVNIAFEAAAARGKTILAAAGDSGATDGVDDGAVHVDFPASSPWVLACGGTRLTAHAGAIVTETVWNDLSSNEGATGGGVSRVFPLPSWQSTAQIPDNATSNGTGRGLPDVASLADPETPFIVAQPSGSGGVGGTSAAAPLWASLIARINAELGTPVGYLNPQLYGLSPAPLRDITQGSNAAAGGPGYDAGPGWDACTGWGAPGGTALAAALGSPSAPAPPPTPAT